MEPVELSTHG